MVCDVVADGLLLRRDAHSGGGVQGTHGEESATIRKRW